MLDYPVPFYANTPDGTHCFQAVLKMVLKYFLPQEEYTFEELERITAKVKGLWTWPMAGLIWMHKKEFDIKKISNLIIESFYQKANNTYLISMVTRLLTLKLFTVI